jgi:hypothetical protein
MLKYRMQMNKIQNYFYLAFEPWTNLATGFNWILVSSLSNKAKQSNIFILVPIHS